MLSENLKPKSFFQKPEGKTGLLVGLVGLFGLGWGLYKILPFLITLLENTIYLSILGVTAFVLFSILSDPKFWQVAGAFYKSAMRFLTGLIIQIDPIGILKDYVSGLQKKLISMDKQIEALSGMIQRLKSNIEENVQQATTAMKMAVQADKAKKRPTFVLKARQAGRLQDSNKDLQEVLTKMEILYRVLDKMREACAFYIEDIQDQINVASRKYESIRAAYKAMRMAQRIIQGDRDKELFMQTMEYMAKDYGQKVGEIENFIAMSSAFIDSVDLQNGIYEEDAMKMLEEWEKKGDSLILGDTKSFLIQQSYDPTQELDLRAQQEGPRDSKNSGFSKLFN